MELVLGIYEYHLARNAILKAHVRVLRNIIQKEHYASDAICII
jgi:hypothetical protein